MNFVIVDCNNTSSCLELQCWEVNQQVNLQY